MLRKFLKRIFDKLTLKNYREQIIWQQDTHGVEMRHIYNQIFLNNPVMIVQNVKIYLPLFYVDHIQKTIFRTRNFYEINTLTFLQLHYKKFDNVIDIGSNIGNHMLFYCSCMDAKQVHCFEPNEYNFATLRTNISLNNLDDVVKTYPVPLGAAPGKGVQQDFSLKNTGMNRIVKADENNIAAGTIDIRALDEFDIQNVSFIKIDVEGFEMEVLMGAKKTIEKWKPVIMVEVFELKRKEVDVLMEEFGYRKLIMLGENNCIYESFETV